MALLQSPKKKPELKQPGVPQPKKASVSPPGAPGAMPAPKPPGGGLLPATDATAASAEVEKPMTGPPTQTLNIGKRQTVSGQMDKLLASDSPYLEAGRQSGLLTAAERGMTNSTMAAGAGELARVQSALPIAQQDAAMFSSAREAREGRLHERGMLTQQGGINSQLQREQHQQNQELQAQQHVETLAELAAQGDVNARLQMEQFGFDSSLSAQENLQRLEQIAADGDVRANLMLAEFGYSSLLADQAQGFALELEDERFQNSITYLGEQTRNALQLSEVEHRQTLDAMQAQHENNLDVIAAETEARGEDYARNLQSQYLYAVGQSQMMAQQAVAQIMTQEGLTSEQQRAAVQYTLDSLYDQNQLLANYYAGAEVFDWNAIPSAEGPPELEAPPPVTNTPEDNLKRVFEELGRREG